MNPSSTLKTLIWLRRASTQLNIFLCVPLSMSEAFDNGQILKGELSGEGHHPLPILTGADRWRPLFHVRLQIIPGLATNSAPLLEGRRN